MTVTEVELDDSAAPIASYSGIGAVFGLSTCGGDNSFLARAASEGLVSENVYAVQIASSQSVENLGVDMSHI